MTTSTTPTTPTPASPTTPAAPDGSDEPVPAVPAEPAVPGGAGEARPGPTPSTAQSRQALGAYGERVAARHLVEKGLRLLDRNWRCDEGEIDLVLRERDVLVVCEVKTRTSLEHGTPHEAVTDAKLDRLRRLGARWATAHDVSPPETRVDLVAVMRPPRGAATVEHVPGIG